MGIKTIIGNIIGGFSIIGHILTMAFNDIKRVRRFRHLFLISAAVLGIVLMLLLILTRNTLIAFCFFVFYGAFIIVTFSFIIKISEANEKKYLTKYEFLKFLISYFFIIGCYIWIFSQVFLFLFLLDLGGFLFDNRYVPLDTMQALFISGITFVSYDVGFLPTELNRFFVFFEIFFSQTVIIGFLFIVFGQLLSKILNFNDEKKLIMFKNELTKLPRVGNKTGDKIIGIYKKVFNKTGD